MTGWQTQIVLWLPCVIAKKSDAFQTFSYLDFLIFGNRGRSPSSLLFNLVQMKLGTVIKM